MLDNNSNNNNKVWIKLMISCRGYSNFRLLYNLNKSK